jgi:hypothetical protein
VAKLVRCLEISAGVLLSFMMHSHEQSLL